MGLVDRINSVIELPDSTIIAAGFTNANPSQTSYGWPGKFTADGETLWTRCYEGPPNHHEAKFEQVQATSDGGFVVTANAYSSAAGSWWMLKLDASGDTIWTRRVTDHGAECTSVEPHNDGGYVFGGYTGVEGRSDLEARAIKVDAFGVIVWDYHYGTIDNDESGNDLAVTSGATSQSLVVRAPCRESAGPG
jgi:hypothetical protein